MTERIDNLPGILITAFAAFWETVLGFLPNVIASLLVLGLGLFMARFSKIVVDRLLVLTSFEELVRRTGLESYFSGTGYVLSFTSLISGTVYWLVILLTVSSIADLLHLATISDLFERFVLYLPNVIIAVIIVIVGTIVARIVNRYFFNITKDRSMDLALTVGLVAEVIVQVFVIFLALEQLLLNTIMLLIVLSAVVGGVALAAAIAFGLAGQRYANELLERMHAKIEGGIDKD